MIERENLSDEVRENNRALQAIFILFEETIKGFLQVWHVIWIVPLLLSPQITLAATGNGWNRAGVEAGCQLTDIKSYPRNSDGGLA